MISVVITNTPVFISHLLDILLSKGILFPKGEKSIIDRPPFFWTRERWTWTCKMLIPSLVAVAISREIQMRQHMQ